MGLDTTHGCWHGAYSAFNRWRTKIAEVAGLPPLSLMDGFYSSLTDDRALAGGTLYHGNPDFKWHSIHEIDSLLPISWECLKPSPLHELLHHSDCEGEIPWESCGPIADCLTELLGALPDEDAGGHIGNWIEKTQEFINGLRLAATNQENVEFH